MYLHWVHQEVFSTTSNVGPFSLLPWPGTMWLLSGSQSKICIKRNTIAVGWREKKSTAQFRFSEKTSVWNKGKFACNVAKMNGVHWRRLQLKMYKVKIKYFTASVSLFYNHISYTFLKNSILWYYHNLWRI